MMMQCVWHYACHIVGHRLTCGSLNMNSDGANLYFTWCGAQRVILTATLQQTESARHGFIFASFQNPATVHGPLKGTFLPLCCGLKTFNSLDLSPLSCISPKFSGLIKATIPSVKPASERVGEEGSRWWSRKFLSSPIPTDILKLQLPLEQPFLRMTRRLAEQIFLHLRNRKKPR